MQPAGWPINLASPFTAFQPVNTLLPLIWGSLPVLFVHCGAPAGGGAAPEQVQGEVAVKPAVTVTFRVDRSTPEAVFNTIQGAIKAHMLDSLKLLCDPQEIVDKSSLTLCNIATDDMEHIDKFKNWFEDATITGAAMYQDNLAMLPVLLDPPTQATPIDLVMIQRNGQWFLSSFTWK